MDSLEDPTLGAWGFGPVSQKCPLDGARWGAPDWAGAAAWLVGGGHRTLPGGEESGWRPWGGARAHGGGQGGVQARLAHLLPCPRG